MMLRERLEDEGRPKAEVETLVQAERAKLNSEAETSATMPMADR